MARITHSSDAAERHNSFVWRKSRPRSAHNWASKGWYRNTSGEQTAPRPASATGEVTHVLCRCAGTGMGAGLFPSVFFWAVLAFSELVWSDSRYIFKFQPRRSPTCAASRQDVDRFCVDSDYSGQLSREVAKLTEFGAKQSHKVNCHAKPDANPDSLKTAHRTGRRPRASTKATPIEPPDTCQHMRDTEL